MNTQQMHLKAANDIANKACKLIPEHLRVAQLSATLTSLAYEVLQRGGLVQIPDLEHFVIFAAEQNPEQPEAWIKQLITLRKKHPQQPRAELVDTSGILQELQRLQGLRAQKVQEVEVATVPVSDPVPAPAAPTPAVLPAVPVKAVPTKTATAVASVTAVPPIAVPDLSDAKVRLQYATKMARLVADAIPTDASVEVISISLFYQEPTAQVADVVKLFQAIPSADLKQLVQFRKKKYGMAQGSIAQPESIRQEMLALQSRYLNNLQKSKRTKPVKETVAAVPASQAAEVPVILNPEPETLPAVEAHVPNAEVTPSVSPTEYAQGLKAALRQAPDVKLVGENRDPATAPVPAVTVPSGSSLQDPPSSPSQAPAPLTNNAFPISLPIRIRGSVKAPPANTPIPTKPTVIVPIAKPTAVVPKVVPAKTELPKASAPKIETPPAKVDMIPTEEIPDMPEEGIELTFEGNEFSEGVDIAELGQEPKDFKDEA